MKSEGGLDFRSMEAFNLALLAKQGRRIIKNLVFLAAKVLKAKYFAMIDFLNTKLGSNPSYLWRSLLARRILLQRGVVWRVGDVSNIQVWDDLWLPYHPSF